MAEYYEVLHREKFTKYPDFVYNAEILLATIGAKALMYRPKTRVSIITDQEDNKLLELAAESKANYLITGNTNDFTMAKFKRTKILTPKEYWEKYQPK